MRIEVPVLRQESEWSWYEYRSACLKPGKWVVMIFFIEVPVLSQESEWSWYFVIEVPVLSQESEWSWYFVIEVPVLSQKVSGHDIFL